MIILRKLGRRLTFLIFIPILAAANAWSSRAQSFGSLIAATILSSLACGAGEAPVATIAADLYSVRERGSTMMVFNIALSAGLFVGPLINSTIAEFVGWRWVCGWIGIASILLWLITFGMVHETCSYPQGQLNDRNLLPETLSLKAGYNRDLSLVTAATNTICVIAYPSVLWAGVTIGVFVGWNVVVQLTASQVLHLPPYNFDLYRIGLVMLSGFIGSVLAIFFGGRLIDVVANRMTDRAQGKREAEYRLPGLLLPAIIGPLGVLTFGLCAAKQLSWTGLAFGCGMQGFGLTAGSNVLVTAGMENAFGQMVAIEYVLLLIGIAFMIYGSKIRSWTSSFGPVATCM
ncbi:hypothetical protein TCE0_018f05876 [Talaromyces pinophilus]|uniref:Major facilitator superfamily (MFS) profile domain-containing protein n=1 Tax=Talaromyces pinophilus TaxID=128442 RepID=A0A510NWL9_TALPI|nr:hypothetical protein TCE0_018f05876 [Talaromyces pinophilus]